MWGSHAGLGAGVVTLTSVGVEGSGHMPQYGVEHVTVLVVIVVITVVCVVVTRRTREDDSTMRVLRISGWVLLAVSAVWMVWGMLPANWDVHQSLPFHFSDAARYLAAIALITRAGWAIVILYYWGLTLNLQSVLTPDLNYLQFPVLEFAMYWILHAAVLIAPIVLTWGLGYRPTWRGYAFTFGATVAWAAVAFVVNLMTGSNYSYVSGGPAGASLLDVLGPWPLYLLSVAGLMLVVWGLMTWPWETEKSRAATCIPDRFALVRRPASLSRQRDPKRTSPAEAAAPRAPRE